MAVAKKNSKSRRVSRTSDGMRREYDFSRAVKGKYTKEIPADAIMVVLDPDVAHVFRSSQEVNSVLRLVATAAERSKGRPKTGPKRKSG